MLYLFSIYEFKLKTENSWGSSITSEWILMVRSLNGSSDRIVFLRMQIKRLDFWGTHQILNNLDFFRIQIKCHLLMRPLHLYPIVQVLRHIQIKS